ncbi:Hypothetical protein CINCED_3A011331 [Cinara cedri]|uniref:Uncharacterized protein n=1 Tax=Cinara cedri TaxID=506608 RepID=A0A5E4NMF8_9HEMI|nr:Hypothetical protein CINCED_3A011331 [Cinara cedri]
MFQDDVERNCSTTLPLPKLKCGISRQQVNEKYEFMSLALDEPIDIQDKPQLDIFVRYMTMNMEVKEELLDFIALKETTRDGRNKKN